MKSDPEFARALVERNIVELREVISRDRATTTLLRIAGTTAAAVCASDPTGLTLAMYEANVVAQAAYTKQLAILTTALERHIRATTPPAPSVIATDVTPTSATCDKCAAKGCIFRAGHPGDCLTLATLEGRP